MHPGYAKFKGHHCFKDEWSGFDKICPINLIIGKNNTGKSHLISFVNELCKSKTSSITKWDIKFSHLLDSHLLEQAFPAGVYDQKLGSYLMNDHGHHFRDQVAEWTKEKTGNASIHFSDNKFYTHNVSPLTANQRIARLEAKFNEATHFLNGKSFRHLLADRDIRPEQANNRLALEPDGRGATNIIQRFIHSTDQRFNRDLIQIELLGHLNEVFGSDGKFEEITARRHDGKDDSKPDDLWEIYLKQEHKGLVSLSDSGSGLKTVVLVLLNLLAIPKIEKSANNAKTPENYVYAFEELENNLHPSLLRNLLNLIRKKSLPNPNSTKKIHPHFFITTHSSVALDFFTNSKDSQIVHVSHDGRSGRTQTIEGDSNLLDILWDLGTRPSDLLQANGIVWVEGPSDRIYFNKWIEIISNGQLREGRHYQCAFYGGALLSSLEATHYNQATGKLVNLLKLNPNTIVLSDSDRRTPKSPLKLHVRRIRDEFDKLDRRRAFHWILEVREIENYLTGSALKAVFPKNSAIPSPEKYESFFPKEKEINSFLEDKLGRKSIRKSELAIAITSHLTMEDLTDRFDLFPTMKKISKMIEDWNR